MITFTRKILVLVVVVLLLAVSVRAAVMGIDLGSEFIKIAAPKNKGIDIVLNEQSNRKSANFIGFRREERFFGDDAKNLAPRFPDNMFTFINNLVGVGFNDTARLKWFKETMVQHYNLEEAVKPVAEEEVNSTAPEDIKKLGTVAVRTGGNPDIAYTTETLLAMMFTYIRETVAKDTGIKVRDAVVTIPAYYNSRQRQAIIDAAALAGVNVVATMHTTTAFALQRGIREAGFGNETKRIMIYDMGTSRTDVGIYEYTPAPPPPKGKKVRNAEFYGHMTTLAIVSDPTVSGRAFDQCLAKLIEDRFVEATKLPRVLAGETLAKRKSVFALMRAANKAKETLTANKRTTVIAEGMAPNKDFPTTIAREEFEQACAPLFNRALELATEASKKANIGIDKLDFLELAGGVSRIPKLGNDLSNLRGANKQVDRTMNADEAGAIGAAYFGGVITGRFPAIRSFGVKEGVFITHPTQQETSVSFALSPKKEGDALQFRALFPAGSLIGQVKSVTVNRTEDFNISVAVVTTENGAPVQSVDYHVRVAGVQAGLRSVPFYKSLFGGLNLGENGVFSGSTTVNFGGDSNSTELNHPNNTHSIRIEFRASESGLVVVESVELRVTYAKNVTKRIQVNMTEEEIVEEEKKTRESVIAREVMLEEETKMKKAAKAAAKANATNATENNTTETEVPETPESLEKKANETAKKQKLLEAKIAKAIATMKRTKTVPTIVEEMQKQNRALKFRLQYAFPSPLTKGDKKLLKIILEEFDMADEQRRAKAKSRNDLDAYMVWTRGEGILDNSEIKELGILTAEAEAEVSAALQKAHDFMYETATDDTPTEEFIAALKTLKSVVDPYAKALKTAKKKPGTPEPEPEANAAPKAGAEESSDQSEFAEGAPEDSASDKNAEEADGAEKPQGDSDTEL